jgi:F0F1-type ATP synthase membrane subunit b/b'
MNQLKEAEKKANQLVQDARKGMLVWNLFAYFWSMQTDLRFCILLFIARTDRMKDAKAEAEQIIAAYKAEMEASYKEAQLKVRFCLLVW